MSGRLGCDVLPARRWWCPNSWDSTTSAAKSPIPWGSVTLVPRAHPGAELITTTSTATRITAFATNTRTGPLADLELRHRRRAHCEDRIRLAKDTGLTNLPLHDFAQNQIWCAIVALARADRLDATPPRWSTRPRRQTLRYPLYTIPAALARGGRPQQWYLLRQPPPRGRPPHWRP